jgi:hypothetical protein
VLNRFFRKGLLQVVGSPWLPGFYTLKAEEAVLVPPAILNQGRTCKMLLCITSGPVEASPWYSFEGDPMMVLRVRDEWKSFENYMASFKQKYRQRIKKAMKDNAALEVREVVLGGAVREELGYMLNRSLKDRVVALPADTTQLLSLYEQCFSSHYKIWAFYKGEAIHGFISVLEDGPVLRAMHFASNEDAPDGFYTRAMMKVVEHGILGGFAEINLGRTATEIKSTYGAEPRENYFSFYSSARTTRLLLAAIAKRYRPKSYIIRSPFK